MSGPAIRYRPGAEQAAEAAPATGRFSRDFWLVFAASFAFNTAGNLFVLFPLFVMNLGGSAGVIGVVVGTGSLAALAMRPAVGSGIDRFGRKWMALRFLFLDGIAMLLYATLSSLGWALYFVRVLQGAVDGTARVALFAFVYDILPAGRAGEGMSIYSLCGMVPAALAPIAGEELIRRFGFVGFFAAAGALCLAAAATTLMLPDDRPADGDPGGPSDGLSYGALLADRRLMPLWIAAALWAITLSSRGSFLAPFAYQRGIQRVGWYFLIYSTTAVILRLFGGRMADRIGLQRMMVPSFMVFSGGIALLALTGRPGMLPLAAVVGGMGHAYAYPLLSALVIGRTQAGAAGRSSTIYSSLYDFGAMAGPYLLGAIASGFGYPVMFVVAGGVTLAAACYVGMVELALGGRRMG